MSANQVTGSINNALNQSNQTQGGRTQMNALPLQETVLMKSVYDPSTGRTMIMDGNGRRVTPRRDMTGVQLVRINNMRQQLGLGYLKDHNVNMMSIDSASLMIDDLIFFNNKMRMYEDTIASLQNTPEQLAQRAREQQARNVQR